MRKARNWVFTLNADDDQSVTWIAPSEPCPIADWYDTGNIQYMVCQVEKVQHVHIQGYVQMKENQRMSAMKKLNDRVHWEVRRGTHEEAKQYCMKAESRMNGPWEFGEEKNSQGKRTDLIDVTDKVKSGSSLVEIAYSYPSVYVKYHRGITALMHVLRPSPKWRELTVTVLYGSTGTGKTRSAYESCDNPYFVVMPGTWWDGYDAQDTVIFDDFYGQIRASDMLRYLDGYPLQLPVKGGFTWAHWTKVFITSNVHPSQWWSSTQVPSDVRDAISRRLSEITQLGI